MKVLGTFVGHLVSSRLKKVSRLDGIWSFLRDIVIWKLKYEDIGCKRYILSTECGNRYGKVHSRRPVFVGSTKTGQSTSAWESLWSARIRGARVLTVGCQPGRRAGPLAGILAWAVQAFFGGIFPVSDQFPTPRAKLYKMPRRIS